MPLAATNTADHLHQIDHQITDHRFTLEAGTVLSRTISLSVLAGTTILIGLLFFRVVWPLLFPLFFAVVLAVLFRPVYLKLVRVCAGHRHIAAILTTAAISCLILLPIAGVLTMAGIQFMEISQDILAYLQNPDAENQGEVSSGIWENLSQVTNSWNLLDSRLNEEGSQAMRDATSNMVSNVSETVFSGTATLAGNVIEFVVGLCVMVVALYFFFSDGEKMVEEAHELLPYEGVNEDRLFHKFDDICRGVILGTIAAALVQGALAGIAFYFLGVKPFWLLVVITVFFGFVPVVGTSPIWLFVVITLYFEQRYAAMIFLCIYGMTVIASADNVVRAYVISDRARMHPLIAFVTVIGAMNYIGLWGIFIGPITASFFYALLKTLHAQLRRSSSQGYEQERDKLKPRRYQSLHASHGS